MSVHTLTGVDGYFADRATRYLLDALFDDSEVDSWQSRASCAQVDPDLFFPDQGGQVRTPKQVCARCPVRVDCLDYALTNDERHGVWGGLSERERRQLRRTAHAA